MSASSATWYSLMNKVQVVCIDQMLTSPSLTLKRLTNAMIVFVKSTSSTR